MTTLTLKCGSDFFVIIQDNSSFSLLDLPRLSAFIGGKTGYEIQRSNPSVEIVLRKDCFSDETLLFDWGSCRIVYDASLCMFRYLLNPEVNWSRVQECSQTKYWSCLVRHSIYAEILRGRPIILLHGAALKTKQGVLVLCGQGGMGKSTTASRWKQTGGSVLCDDMMLLEAVNEQIVVHPLPTWSRSFQSREGENVHFEETYPVCSVIALNRSQTGQEYLEEVDERLYYSSIYSACCIFMNYLIKRMPQREQIKLQSAAASWADRLAAQKHRALFADLQGDLRQTLRDFINDGNVK